MPSKILRIATRRSPLAICQAEIVKHALEKAHPDLTCVLVTMETSGDKLLNHPLSTAGGKGLFIKELEVALLENQADIAVHSMKDMPVTCAEGLIITAFLEREDPRDVFVSKNYAQLNQLPLGAKIGTASLRRQAIVKSHRADLQTAVVRGNVQTRVQKMENGDYDALILAAAGLHRLKWSDRIRHYFSPEESLPAIGQGIIGVECRAADKAIKKLLVAIDHYPTRQCLLAERAMNRTLGGNCHAPIGGYATVFGEMLTLRGWVLARDGQQIIKSQSEASITQPEVIGEQVAKLLIAQGAMDLLNNNG